MKNKSFFWTSYSDLMTSLFFVMLLLFVTTVIMMYAHGKANEEEQKKYTNWNTRFRLLTRVILNITRSLRSMC